jgi:hypothetical protein
VNPAKLSFHQLTMRQHYNDIFNRGEITKFKSKYFEDKVLVFQEHNVDLSDLKLKIKKNL